MEGSGGGTEQLREVLPGYEVSGLLGRGAMGEVLAGRHERLDRAVAIKRLPPAFAEDPEVRERFGQEARVLASLNHPHIVPVYDYVERDGLCLLVMEALPGGTVWDRFTGDGLTMPTACSVVLATCAGLAYAHEKRVLHRDVKPDNLMFDAEGGLKVTDFGIATVFGGDETLATVDGGIVGTPAYMAPEQADGRTVGPAADVYAAATMLYELLSGRLPFDTVEEPHALLRARIDEDPVPLDQVAPSVPPGLVAATMRGLARDPKDRYESAEAFGVAVGEAATAAWGPAWLASSEVRLMASGAIAGATEAAAAPTDVARSTAAPGESRATRITGDRADGSDGGAAATIVPGAVPAEAGDAPDTIPPEAIPGERVVGADAAHAAGADLADVKKEDMVRVQDVLRPPPTPWATLAGALALLLAMVVVAGGLLGGPDREPSVDRGSLRVAGVDVGGTDPVPVDLGAPIRVRLDQAPPGAGDVTGAQLAISGLGLPLGTSNDEPFLPGDGFVATELSATSLRLITSGTVTAELRLLDESGAEVFTTEFALEPDQAPFLSGIGIVSLLVLFGGLAYGWGLSRPLRSGRRRFVPLLGVAGAAVGAGLTLALWSAGGEEPVLAALVVAAGLGALGGLVGGWALGRLGRARRIRRALRTAPLGR